MMRLCDAPLSKIRTCSAPLCVQCAIRVSDEEDYCPTHAPAAYAERAAQILGEAQRRRVM
jgi:hypothetical protein